MNKRRHRYILPRLSRSTVAAFLVLAFVGFAAAQNELQKIPDGGFVTNWLISNAFPAEIDAGMWENFNRFNIERLPQKDWLAPFGKPAAGVSKAGRSQGDPAAVTKSNAGDGSPLPEVGAASTTKTFTDATEIAWTPFAEKDATIAFHLFHEGKPIGTAYAAAYVTSERDETRFIETDGFLGTIWLNGERIYDGYTLTLKKVVAGRFKKGENLLVVRSSGVLGDYWRKDGGWSALVKFWRTREAAEKSAGYKSINQPGSIFYLEGFHVDPVYLQDQRGYSKVTLANVSQYLQSLRADPKYGVYLSEIDYLKPYLDTHPEDREFLRKAVADGRVGTGGSYNQFNEMNIGGEAMIRNILYGQEMHNAMLGRKAESLALWDVFGHAPQLSQIAAKSGFTGVVWSKKITGFQPFFYDYALDGSKLLHRRLDYAYSFSGFGSGKNYSLDNFLKMTERKFAEPITFGSSVDLRINAADFTPPWTNLAGNVERLESNRPQIRVTGQAQDLYFRALNKEIAEGKVTPPFTSRDKLFFHVGVMMARSDLKIGQRYAENMTLTAEKFGAIAYLLGTRYPDLALDKAWRQIFFGSHHDAITGTPSDSAFLDLVLGYREAYELSKGALNGSLKFIARQIDTNPKTKFDDAIPIVVFNPMNWKRTDLTRAEVRFHQGLKSWKLVDESGKRIDVRRLSGTGTGRGNVQISDNRVISHSVSEPVETSSVFEFIATDVPSIGYRTYFVVPTDKAEKEKAPTIDSTYIENEFYKVSVDPSKGGAVTSILDKTTGREVVNTADGHFGNEIALLKEELTRKNVTYPAWEMWTTGDKTFSTSKPAKTVAYERGQTQTIAVTGELPNTQKFVQIIELHKGVKRIDFKTELVDYKGYNELFTVNFPLNLSGGALVTEDRFGTVVRNGSRGFLDFKTNTDKLISGAPVYGTYNWAEYGSVFDLRFTDGKKMLASVPFKPTALMMPHSAAHEKAAEAIVANFIKRGVSVTPFYDDNDAARRRNLSIEDSTMPTKLNDDIAYHGFRIVLGGEKENAYTAELLRLVTPETKASFERRTNADGYGFLFLYDKNVPDGWKPVPVLLIAGDVGKAADQLTLPIRAGSSADQPSSVRDEKEKSGYEKADAFAINLSFESFATETNPVSELPRVPDYGVALINGGTPAVSLEGGNTLTLHLTHTAPWPGANLSFEFVPENKTHVFTYSLYPHEKDWREADAVRVGYDVNNPLIAIATDVHAGELPPEKSFVDSSVSGLVVSALKLGGNPLATFRSKEFNKMARYPTNELSDQADGRSLILRAYESEGRAAAPGITTGFRVNHGAEIGLIEQEGSQSAGIAFAGRGLETNAFGANEIRTYELFAERAKAIEPAVDQTKEAVQPVFSKYWRHNMGAAPIGNDAVKVSLRPVEQMGDVSTFAWDDPYNQGGITTTAVRVQVVNNYQDRKVSGEVKLEVPEDWRVVPDRIAYDIDANGSFVKDVVVLAYPVKNNLEFERASGLVKARIEHDGQTFQDVLQIGKTFKLEWRTGQTANGVTVFVKNPHRQAIEGAVALITPPETWIGGMFSIESRFPREQGFSVPANSEISVKFDHGALPEGAWRIARLVYNGNVEYKRADGKAR